MECGISNKSIFYFILQSLSVEDQAALYQFSYFFDWQKFLDVTFPGYYFILHINRLLFSSKNHDNIFDTRKTFTLDVIPIRGHWNNTWHNVSRKLFCCFKLWFLSFWKQKVIFERAGLGFKSHFLSNSSHISNPNKSYKNSHFWN